MDEVEKMKKEGATVLEIDKLREIATMVRKSFIRFN